MRTNGARSCASHITERGGGPSEPEVEVEAGREPKDQEGTRMHSERYASVRHADTE